MQGLVFLVPALLAPRVGRPGDLALPLLLGTSVEQEAVALLEAPRPAVYDGRVLAKEQASFNFMAAITICSEFGAPKNLSAQALWCIGS